MGFPRLGYSQIRKIFDQAKIDYKKKTIVQDSTLKGNLEGLRINRETNIIVPLDAIAMYPSITYKMVEIAVNFYGRDLPPLGDMRARG